MIKINLLPYREIQKKEKVWLQLLTMILILVGSLLLVGLAHWRIVAYESSLRDEKDTMSMEIVELDKKIGQIDKMKSQKNEIERKLQVIDLLNQKRIFTAQLLHKVAGAIPDKLWLTGLQDRDKDVVLDGEGVTANEVSSFMERLDKLGLFQKINLISLDQVQKGDQKIIKFNLNSVKVESGVKP
jgi:type IV pilus assembly protein PilN